MRTNWLPGTDWSIPQQWGCTSYAAEPDCSICRAACNCSTGHFHNGIDIACPVGTPIVAAVPCRLVQVGNDSSNPNFGFGPNYPLLDINGTQFLFGHTSQVVGPVPRDLQTGELFAYSGQAGSPGAPHTHAQANRTYGSFQDTIDPVPFLLLGGDDFLSALSDAEQVEMRDNLRVLRTAMDDHPSQYYSIFEQIRADLDAIAQKLSQGGTVDLSGINAKLDRLLAELHTP